MSRVGQSGAEPEINTGTTNAGLSHRVSAFLETQEGFFLELW